MNSRESQNRFEFVCTLEHGMHARPASVLADALRPFTAQVELIKSVSGVKADLRSVLSVVALDVAHGDVCAITAVGDDAQQAMAAVRAIIEEGFGEAAALQAAAAHKSAEPNVPAGLRRLGVQWVNGRAASPGFAHGPLLVIRSHAAASSTRRASAAEDAAAERDAAANALREVRQRLQSQLDSLSRNASPLERDLLQAHLAIAHDPALQQRIEENINQGAAASEAVQRAGEFFVRTFTAAASQYIRDRAIDVQDICTQILEHLGETIASPILELKSPVIIAADLLTPRQMMQLDRSKALGLILGRVGATSHTAILARAFGIPTIVDVTEIETLDSRSATKDDRESSMHVILDANGGFVVPPEHVTPDVLRYYEIERRTAQRRRVRLQPYIDTPAMTRDGKRLEIAANVSTVEEIRVSIGEGAEGVGLFRTEMLFLDRPTPPTEQEQFEIYAQAVQAANGRTVIFRTLDIGGDKPAPYLRIPREENPFLGVRGIRLYQQFPEIIRTQLHAILRASAATSIETSTATSTTTSAKFADVKSHRVWIMAPMVATPAEARQFRELVRRVQDELRSQQIAFDENLPVGLMIEVPAAALAIDELSKHADFFSIGTNDLSQYFLAVDRGNPAVAHYCDELQPALLRLLRIITEAARKNQRWVGVCGELAGDAWNLPVMLSIGVDEISVSPARVLELKAALAQIDSAAGHRVSAPAPDRKSHAASLHASSPYTTSPHAAPLITPDLVMLNAAASSKVEAIKELAGLMIEAGRAKHSHAVENAVWAREDTYATGMGFGFAIPHCKTNAVHSATIAVAKFAQPIDWGSADGELVSVAIMLAIPEAPGGAATEKNEEAAGRVHMQVLAQLARNLMHEEFRHRILNATTPEEVVNALAIDVKSAAASQT